MIAIDTNIVVRLLTHDDAIQFKKAYNFDTEQIADALTKLFGLSNVHINHPSLLAQAIAWHIQGLDFSDAFHLANSQQCKKTLLR